MPRLRSSASKGLAITVLDLLAELLRFRTTAAFPEFSGRRKLVSAQAAGVLSGTRNETASTGRCSEDHSGVLVALVGLEAGIGHPSATDPDSVVPPRVPAARSEFFFKERNQFAIEWRSAEIPANPERPDESGEAPP
jgi:hypothetical protein